MKSTVLKETFTNLANEYSNNTTLINELWNEIELAYSGNKRHYHNLHHLGHLLEQLLPIKDKINHWNTILFTLYYHDIIYNPLKSNNEEKSAALAAQRLLGLYVPQTIIDSCTAQILATKQHLWSTENDTNYFTDADLSILGQGWEHYRSYAENIRKEYAIYPDLIYTPGRRKVVEHFLKMQPIFKTTYFFERLEIAAKQNLQREIEAL